MTEDFPALPALVRFLPGFIKRRIANRPNLVKILDNIGWLFFDKILRMGVGLIVGVWVARYLGPEQFGVFNFALAFVGIFGAIAGLGLQGIVVRDIVRDSSDKEETLGTAAALKFVGGLASYGLILAVIFWLRPDDALAKTIVAILGSTLLFKISEVAVYWFESQVLSKYTVWVQNGVFLVFAVIKVILILKNAEIIAFAWISMAEALVVALLMFVMLGLHGPRVWQLRSTIARAKSLLIESWPLLLSGMVLMVQSRIDQIMLGQMVGDVEVGYYSAALRVVEVAAISASILQSTFLPAMINAKKESEKLYLLKLENVYKINALVSIIIALPLAIFSPWIVDILFGEAYSSAILLIRLMALRIFFAHIGMARGIFLLNEGLLKYSAVTMIIGTVVNIVLNNLLIPIYMGSGATIASLISFFVTIFVVDFYCIKTKANTKLILKSIMMCLSILRR